MLARTAKAVFQVQSRQSFGWLRPIAARGLTTTTTMVERRGSEDMVKAAVQKLMMEHSPQDKDRLVQDQQHNSVTTEALQKASYCLQKKLDEVKACLTDVVEEEEDRQTELDTTDIALEQAAAAYIDLLDMVREADKNTADQFKEIREASAAQIREFRQEIDQYRQQHKQA